MPHNKEIEEKIKDFKERFRPIAVPDRPTTELRTGATIPQYVYDWLKEALTSYGKSQYDKGVEETRKSIREEIGGKKVKVNGVVIEQDMKNLGYNQALDEILSLKSLE